MMFLDKNITANEFVVSFAKTFCYNEMVRYANIIKYYNIPVKDLWNYVLHCLMIKNRVC